MGTSFRALVLLVAVLCVPFAVSAVTFIGNVQTIGNTAVTGSLSKGGGTFVIDHPLDPHRKTLAHSFVESPDVKNLYDGLATLDENGEARITLPSYFMALNEEFRYQFFPLDAAMPELHIQEEVAENAFAIAGGVPGGRVSWQITGIRHDPYIEANPIRTEVWKSEATIVGPGEYLFEGYEEQGLGTRD